MKRLNLTIDDLDLWMAQSWSLYASDGARRLWVSCKGGFRVENNRTIVCATNSASLAIETFNALV